MRIILTWAGRYLFWSFVRRDFFFYSSCSNFRLNVSKIRFILSYSRIWICFPNIFSSYCHIFFIISKFFKMSIILTWSRILFYWSLLKLILFNDCWWYGWFNLINCNIYIVCSYWRILIWFPFIFSSYCHFLGGKSKFF